MGTRHCVPHTDVTKPIRAKAAWKQNETEPLKQGGARDPKRSLRRHNNGNCTFYEKKRRRNGSRITWKERQLWQESELKMQRQQLNRSSMI